MRLINRPLTDDLRARLKNVTKQGSQFSGSWRSTLQLLDRECGYLLKRGTSDVVLMIDVDESMLKLDGDLRANARPYSPNLAVALESTKGPLIFPCGKFWDWRDNVRAVALGMEALRKVDRYGISPNAEQYRGWQALPPGTPMPAAKMTVEEAEEFMRVQSQWVGEFDPLADRVHIDIAYRSAAKRLHPDAGGDPALFRKLTEARDLLVVS